MMLIKRLLLSFAILLLWGSIPFVLYVCMRSYVGPGAAHVIALSVGISAALALPFLLVALGTWARFGFRGPLLFSGGAFLLAAAVSLMFPFYRGEYTTEFEVERLAWRLERMPPARRAGRPEHLALASLATAPSPPADWEQAVDASSKLQRLGLVP
jgi:hypothetical protein